MPRNKTNVDKKPIIREHGIQSYRTCEKSYSDTIRTPTFKAAHDAVVIKESEFAKPYGDIEDVGEDYSGMEYPAPNLPTYPGIDYPGMGLPVPDFEDMYDPWHMTFFCAGKPCFCEGETKEFGMGCTHGIDDAYFFPSVRGLSVKTTKMSVSITAIEGYSGAGGNLTVVMKNRIPKGGGLWQRQYEIVYGSHGNIMVSKCIPASECCDGTVTIYDDPSSPDILARGANTTVYFTGSGEDLDWTISGTGFWFDQAYSITSLTGAGLSNKIYCDNSACGSGTITATDCVGNTATGYIRCTTGTWVDDGTYPATSGFGLGGCIKTDGTGCCDRGEAGGYITGVGSDRLVYSTPSHRVKVIAGTDLCCLGGEISGNYETVCGGNCSGNAITWNDGYSSGICFIHNSIYAPCSSYVWRCNSREFTYQRWVCS